MAHSVCVRMVRPVDVGMPPWALVFYERPTTGESAKWTCVSTMLPRPGRGVFTLAGVEDVRDWLTPGGITEQSWYERIEARARAAKVRQAEVAKARPKKAREDVS